MKYLICIVIVGFNCISFGQVKIPALSKINYEFKHIDDRNQPDNPYVEDVTVLMSQSYSLQKSLTIQSVKNSINEMIFNPKTDDKGVVVFGVPKIEKDASSYEYLNDIKEQKFSIFNNIYDTNYSIRQDYPVIAWELQEEQKVIGGYNCQKAKAVFKGRVYFAWFARDIPLPFGPWKLHGLPGLILEVSDEKNEVNWTYAGFEKISSDSDETIDFPKDPIATSEVKFEKLYDALKKNPDAAYKAALAASPKGQLMLTNMYVTGFSSGKHKKVNYRNKIANNPIELSKK